MKTVFVLEYVDTFRPPVNNGCHTVTYGEKPTKSYVWPYVLPKNSTTVQNRLDPLKTYLCSYVTSMNNTHCVYRLHISCYDVYSLVHSSCYHNHEKWKCRWCPSIAKWGVKFKRTTRKNLITDCLTNFSHYKIRSVIFFFPTRLHPLIHLLPTRVSNTLHWRRHLPNSSCWSRNREILEIF